MKTWLRLTLVAATVGGGFAGMVLADQSLSNPAGHRPAYVVLMVAILALYTFVTASGLWFVWDIRRIRPLLAALAIQIPWLSTPLIVYKFAAGFFAVLTVGSPEEPGSFGLHFGAEALLGCMSRFAWHQEIPWSIGANVFALLLLVLAWPKGRTSGTMPPDPVAEGKIAAETLGQAESEHP
jgi:hypothetical protein